MSAFVDLELVAEAGSDEEAVGLCARTETGVVLMDLMMPGMGGVAATQAIRQQCPRTRVPALTNFQDVEIVQQALRAGATGYLLKNVTAGELAAAIRAAHAGRSTLAPEATQALIEAALFRLTPRELEILAWMARGLSNAQIAGQLVVSPMTVKLSQQHPLQVGLRQPHRGGGDDSRAGTDTPRSRRRDRSRLPGFVIVSPDA